MPEPTQNLTPIGIDADGRIFALTNPPTPLHVMFDDETGVVVLKGA